MVALARAFWQISARLVEITKPSTPIQVTTKPAVYVPQFSENYPDVDYAAYLKESELTYEGSQKVTRFKKFREGKFVAKARKLKRRIKAFAKGQKCARRDLLNVFPELSVSEKPLPAVPSITLEPLYSSPPEHGESLYNFYEYPWDPDSCLFPQEAGIGRKPMLLLCYNVEEPQSTDTPPTPTTPTPEQISRPEAFAVATQSRNEKKEYLVDGGSQALQSCSTTFTTHFFKMMMFLFDCLRTYEPQAPLSFELPTFILLFHVVVSTVIPRNTQTPLLYATRRKVPSVKQKPQAAPTFVSSLIDLVLFFGCDLPQSPLFRKPQAESQTTYAYSSDSRSSKPISQGVYQSYLKAASVSSLSAAAAPLSGKLNAELVQDTPVEVFDAPNSIALSQEGQGQCVDRAAEEICSENVLMEVQAPVTQTGMELSTDDGCEALEISSDNDTYYTALTHIYSDSETTPEKLEELDTLSEEQDTYEEVQDNYESEQETTAEDTEDNEPDFNGWQSKPEQFTPRSDCDFLLSSINLRFPDLSGLEKLNKGYFVPDSANACRERPRKYRMPDFLILRRWLENAIEKFDESEETETDVRVSDFTEQCLWIFTELGLNIKYFRAKELHELVSFCLNTAKTLEEMYSEGIAITRRFDALLSSFSGVADGIGLKVWELQANSEYRKFMDLEKLVQKTRSSLDHFEKEVLPRSILKYNSDCSVPSLAVKQIMPMYNQFLKRKLRPLCEGMSLDELHRRCGKAIFDKHCSGFDAYDYLQAKLRLEYTLVPLFDGLEVMESFMKQLRDIFQRPVTRVRRP